MIEDLENKNMYNKIVFTFLLIFSLVSVVAAQTDSTAVLAVQSDSLEAVLAVPTVNDTIANPEIEYTQSGGRKYTIAGVTVTGAPNFDDYAIIGYSGLDVGRTVSVPGSEITAAIRRFVKQGLFSDVKIIASKILDDKIWLEIKLTERPRVSELNFSGVKKGEKEDLEKSIGILKDGQITPNIIDRARQVMKKYLSDKGFSNADINIYQKDDAEKPGYVIANVAIDKKAKVKVNKIIITGNTVLNQMKIDKAMKKTNEKGRWYNFFRSKKFIPEEYKNDKNLLVERYNEAGYRDAYIVKDSVVSIDEKNVNVYITVDEGDKYYFGDISWAGNTIYSTDFLNQLLKIQKGDVYNHKLLNERLTTDQNEAVSKLYTDRGYLFAQIIPVETSVNGDSINFEMRIFEGKQATINHIGITGNDRVYEHVVRRELYTKPGQLYSQSDIMRSLGELARMGHFDPESLFKNIDIKPDQENGTVDIDYNLTTKSSDQIEFSAGWGGTGFVGSVGLKFTNFAIQNLFRPKMYHVVPQGEGQTFSLNYRSGGLAYNSFSLSFLEPWLGGKRPNSLSVSFYFAQQNSYSDRFMNNMGNYYNPYSYGSSYGGYGYGNGYDNSYNYGQSEFDPNKYIRTFVASIGYGKRLKWPDDYFTFYGELSYQLYSMSDWEQYMGIPDGKYHSPSLGITLSRNSVMNPIYPREGSTFSLSLKLTPPYSLMNGKDYADEKMPFSERYKLIEFHKWKFSAKTFTPLDSKQKLVLMTRAEFGYLGYYNKNARSPFETFMLGGDGMSAYSGAYTMGMEYIPLRGYDAGAPIFIPQGSQAGSTSSYLYNKFSVELRYPISLEQSATIYGLAFVDAGNSFLSIKDYNPFNLKRSAGVGVRIFLQMFGMLGIDWAYGFDTVPTTGERSGSHFHFILGQEL
jgi:outer membrane protein insertion porin family